MHLAHIVPTSLLSYLPQRQRTFLALSNLVVNDKRYRSFHQNVNGTLILDNPVHENVEINLHEWIAAVALVEPTVVILPDVIDSGAETLRYARENAERALAVCPTAELMVVPHGVTDAEYAECAHQLVALPGVRWLGISLERRLNDDELAVKLRMSRLRMLHRQRAFRSLKFHFLGISEKGTELNDPFVHRYVTSADTSKYAAFFLTGFPQFPPSPVQDKYPGRWVFGPDPMDYFNAPCPESEAVRNALSDNLSAWTEYAL